MPHIPSHAVVWLDFREAKIFLITAEDVEAQRIKAHTPHRQVHHKAQEVGSGHVHDDHKYFDAILAAIADAEAWLIVGPGETKKDFEKYILEKYRAGHGEELKQKLVGVESMDHPTDGELLAHARKLLKAHDRMTPHDPRIARALRGGTARG